MSQWSQWRRHSRNCEVRHRLTPTGFEYDYSPLETTGNHITTNNPYTSEDELNPNFRVHPRDEFAWGRVFEILSTELIEASNEYDPVLGSELQEEQWSSGKHGGGSRRFIIIRQRKGHCVCLAIDTYGGLGTTKAGITGDHAIAFTEMPVKFDDEDDSFFSRPIRIVSYDPQHRLHVASRLNYTRLYSVEHNVKVWFIGSVHPDSEEELETRFGYLHPQASCLRDYTSRTTEQATEEATDNLLARSETSFGSMRFPKSGQGYQQWTDKEGRTLRQFT